MVVDADYLPKAIGRDDKEVLSQFFSLNEMPDRSNQQYFILFSAGTAKASVSLSASDSRPVSTDLILFDRERRPFFATALRLLAPR